MPATKPKPTMMGVSTEVLALRPKRAVCRATYHAFQRDCGTTDVHAFKIAANASGPMAAIPAVVKMGRYSDQFMTTPGTEPIMMAATCQAPIANPANSRTRIHVIPARLGFDSRKTARGDVLPALRAPFSPPHKNVPATASHTKGIDAAPTRGTACAYSTRAPNTHGNRGENVMVVSNVPHMAPSTATTTNCTSTTALTSLGFMLANCHRA